ncbi:MAG: hypothetical protein KQH83_04870 [Actinobacteria bacterium]|nr:hypothetical protein [Actinomycetota bacterium]
MQRIFVLVLALALMAAACGDDDTSSTTAAPSTTAAATTEAPSSTEAMTTTTEAATTTAAAMSGPEAFIAAAAGMVGEYEGEWSNTTFNSTGALYFNIVEANTEAGFVLIQVDADGNAFGAADPDLTVIEISVDGDALHVGFSEFIGPSTFEIDEMGHFTLTAEPPALGMTLQIDGTLTAEGFMGTYDIPGLAEGTFSATPVG